MSRPKNKSDVRDNRALFEDSDERLDHDAIDDAGELLHVGGTTAEDVERVRTGALRALDARLW